MNRKNRIAPVLLGLIIAFSSCLTHRAQAQGKEAAWLSQESSNPSPGGRFSVGLRTGFTAFSFPEMNDFLDAWGDLSFEQSKWNIPFCLEANLKVLKMLSLGGEAIAGPKTDRLLAVGPDIERWSVRIAGILLGGRLQSGNERVFLYGGLGAGPFLGILDLDTEAFFPDTDVEVKKHKGFGLGAGISGGVGAFIVPSLSVNGAAACRYARVGKLTDEEGRIVQYKIEETSKSIMWSKSEHSDYTTLALDFLGFDVTLGVAFHF